MRYSPNKKCHSPRSRGSEIRQIQDDLSLPPGVLRIKKGYNPNSSSIGTVVYSFPFVFAAVSAILAILGAWLKRDSPDE